MPWPEFACLVRGLLPISSTRIARRFAPAPPPPPDDSEE